MEDQELDNGAPILSVHQLLQHTAEIVNLFNLKCPLTNISDIRLKKLNSFYSFMLDWCYGFPVCCMLCVTIYGLLMRTHEASLNSLLLTEPPYCLGCVVLK